MENIDLFDVLFLDAETTGLPPKNAKWDEDFEQFPHIVSLSWSLGGVEKDYIIYPEKWEIPAATVEIHGITTEQAQKEGVMLGEVLEDFIADCAKAKLLIGHNIYFDISTIKANILRCFGREWYDVNADTALFKGKRIDTMRKTLKFVGATMANSKRLKYPTLEELYFHLFRENFPAHNSMEDVRALVRCVPELVSSGVIELKQKEYPDEVPTIPEGEDKGGSPAKIAEKVIEAAIELPLPASTEHNQHPTPSNTATAELLNMNDF